MATERTHTVTLLAGDGIGPEVTDAVVRILEAAVEGRARSLPGSLFWSAPTRLKSTASTFPRTCTTPSSATTWR